MLCIIDSIVVLWRSCPCILWLLDRASMWQFKNKRPTWCHLLFYFTSYVLNMFRTLIYPSSGGCDCVVELPHRSFCSRFVVCWRFGASSIRVAGWSLQHGLLFFNTLYNRQLRAILYFNIKEFHASKNIHCIFFDWKAGHFTSFLINNEHWVHMFCSGHEDKKQMNFIYLL